MKMSKRKIFVSFDFENDRNYKLIQDLVLGEWENQIQ